MLGRKQEFNLKLNQFIDSLLVALSFWLAHTLRQAASGWFGWVTIPDMDRFYWQLLILTPFTPLVLERMGYYAHPLQKSLARSLEQLVKAMVVMVLVIGLAVIFLRQGEENRSRSLLLLFPALTIPTLMIRETVARGWLRGKLKDKEWRESVIFAGPPDEVDRLLAALPSGQTMELEIVDRIDISREPVSRLVEALHTHSVQRVIFAAGHVHFSRIEEAINACEIEGVEAWLWSDFIQTAIARPTFDALGDKPMLVFRCTPEMSWELMAKNVIDRIGAVFLILVLAIPSLIAYLGIKFSSKGPGVFSQMRSGRYGKPFRMYKFRTMCLDAEERRAALEGQNQMSGPVFKVERDPRIFPFGAILRKLSIDEFPQLINVLRGEMSLVGPRPLPVYEIEKISDAAQRRRLSVKPGLTCLWQVSGRNQITNFDQWVALDLKYIDNWSLWLDITILLRTVPAVLFGSGAK